MTRMSYWMAVVVWMAVGQAMGQTSPYQQASPPGPYQQTPPDQSGVQPSAPVNVGPAYAPNAGGPQGPGGQQLVPQDPTIQRRAPQQPPAPPFVLTPQEQQQLDAALQAWEQSSKSVKTFECKFTRFEYDPVFGNANQPRFVDNGQIKYASPDKGMYRVDGQRPEHWICDGQSVFEYNFQKKELIEYKLPAELRGKAISDGPLPFLFGADAAKLNQRYYMRVTAQPTPTEFKLEALPMYQRDAANFRRAELILRDMQPYGLKIYSPNGKNSTVYVFENIRVNETKLLGLPDFFRSDPFHAVTPRGWQKIVEPGAAQTPNGPPQMSNQSALPRR